MGSGRSLHMPARIVRPPRLSRSRLHRHSWRGHRVLGRHIAVLNAERAGAREPESGVAGDRSLQAEGCVFASLPPASQLASPVASVSCGLRFRARVGVMRRSVAAPSPPAGLSCLEPWDRVSRGGGNGVVLDCDVSRRRVQALGIWASLLLNAGASLDDEK